MELPQEIRDYLDNLTDVEADRVLTSRLASASTFVNEDGSRCLCGAAEDWQITGRESFDRFAPLDAEALHRRAFGPHEFMYRVYEEMLDKHGQPLNDAIRQYILDLRLARTLAPQETVGAV